MILEIISEIQEPLEASQVLHDADEEDASKRGVVRGPSSFNLRALLPAGKTGTPPRVGPNGSVLKHSGSIPSALQNSAAINDMFHEVVQGDWLSYSSNDKLTDLRSLRADFAKKKDLGALQRIDKVRGTPCF